jgi:uncharacterized integral membrane protein
MSYDKTFLMGLATAQKENTMRRIANMTTILILILILILIFKSMLQVELEWGAYTTTINAINILK